MAENVNNTIKTTVELDANQAQREIVKLNSLASDTTQDLEKRVEAKNQQVEIQNKLSKQTIENLEKELKVLEEAGAEQKEIDKTLKKLNKERLNAVKISERNIKQQNKLQDQLKASKSGFEALDGATGGLLGKFKALLANPIGILLSVLLGLFTALKSAISRSGKASETFGKIFAKISGIFNGFLAILEPVVEILGDTLLKAIENPKQAFIDLGNVIKDNIINRFKALNKLLKAGSELLKGNFREAGKIALDGFTQLATGVEDLTGKISNFAETAKEKYTEAAKATEALANAERRLSKNRQDLEKQQLTSLRLAEEQRQIRDDVSKSIEERIAANKRLGEVLDEQLNRELKLAQDALNLAQLRVKADGETIENLEAVGDAELKILEIQERITGQRSEQLVNEQSLIKERDEAIKKAEEDLKAFKDKLRADEDQTELERLEKEKEARLLELETLKLHEEEKNRLKQEIETKFREDKRALELEQAALDAETQLQIDELEIEAKKLKGEKTLSLELALLEKRKQQELSNKELTDKEKLLLEKKYELEADKIRKSAQTAEETKNKAILESGLNSAAEAFGVSKEVALAESIFGLGKSIGDAWAANAKKGFPGNVIATAAQIAGQIPPIVKSISDIKRAKVPGLPNRGSGGGSVSVASVSSAVSIPTATSTSISDLTSANLNRSNVDSSASSQATQTASSNVQGSSSSNVTFSENRYNEFRNQVKFKENKSTI